MKPSKALLDRITAEEKELVLDHFDENDAWELGRLLVEEARRGNFPLSIDIRRPGQILFHAAMPGSAPENDEWVRRKTNTSFRFRQSSLAVAVDLGLQGKTMEDRYLVDPREFAAAGGCFPVAVRGVGMVACATVSGLPQEEDHALVVSCLRKLKAKG